LPMGGVVLEVVVVLEPEVLPLVVLLAPGLVLPMLVVLLAPGTPVALGTVRVVEPGRATVVEFALPVLEPVVVPLLEVGALPELELVVVLVLELELAGMFGYGGVWQQAL
jgi:hypothetical protein